MATLRTVVIQTMQAHGFRLIRKGKHNIWRHANGQQVVTSLTTSDRRSFERIRRDIRRITGSVGRKRS